LFMTSNHLSCSLIILTWIDLDFAPKHRRAVQLPPHAQCAADFRRWLTEVRIRMQAKRPR
jgi:hypothetical protein